MNEELSGQRKEMKAPWTKIFTAFKVALDIKKLLLAAAGILAMAAGWWLLAVAFYNMRSMPQLVEYVGSAKTDAEKEEGFKAFKEARNRWNLLHELAGNDSKYVDEGDLATSYEQYEKIYKANEEVKLPDKMRQV